MTANAMTQRNNRQRQPGKKEGWECEKDIRNGRWRLTPIAVMKANLGEIGGNVGTGRKLASSISRASGGL